jgi:hypothetical protein
MDFKDQLPILTVETIVLGGIKIFMNHPKLIILIFSKNNEIIHSLIIFNNLLFLF